MLWNSYLIFLHSDKKFWRVNLPSALDSGKTVKVTVEAAYTHALTPYPHEITQAEKQLVVLTGNLYVFSPYKVKSQTTTVTTTSSTIESYTKTKPVSVSENTISYGPFENQEPFSQVSIILKVWHLIKLQTEAKILSKADYK